MQIILAAIFTMQLGILALFVYIGRQATNISRESEQPKSLMPPPQSARMGRLRCVPVKALLPTELERLKQFLYAHWDHTPVNFTDLLKLSKYVWIVQWDDKVLACAWASVANPEEHAHWHGTPECTGKYSWILYSVCVHTDYRRRHIFNTLMQKITSDALRQQVELLVLWVDIDLTLSYAQNNSWRLAMYRKVGFKTAGTHQENYGNNFVSCMTKPVYCKEE